jgi:hypothetical protein
VREVLSVVLQAPERFETREVTQHPFAVDDFAGR